MLLAGLFDLLPPARSIGFQRRASEYPVIPPGMRGADFLVILGAPDERSHLQLALTSFVGRYTEAQIIAILRQAEGGVPVAALRREHG